MASLYDAPEKCIGNPFTDADLLCQTDKTVHARILIPSLFVAFARNDVLSRH